MAENFATLDYKTQEEAFTVIKHLTSILSTSGMQLIEVVSPSNLLVQLHEPQQQSAADGIHVTVRPTIGVVGNHLSVFVEPRSTTTIRVEAQHRRHENLGYNLYCDAPEIPLEGVVWSVRGVSRFASSHHLDSLCPPENAVNSFRERRVLLETNPLSDAITFRYLGIDYRLRWHPSFFPSIWWCKRQR